MASPSQPPEGTDPADTSISDSWPSGLQEGTFPLFQATGLVVICDNSPESTPTFHGDCNHLLQCKQSRSEGGSNAA